MARRDRQGLLRASPVVGRAAAHEHPPLALHNNCRKRSFSAAPDLTHVVGGQNGDNVAERGLRRRGVPDFGDGEDDGAAGSECARRQSHIEYK